MIGEARSPLSATSAADAQDELREVASLQELHAELRRRGITPGWAKDEPSLYPEPKRSYEPVHWSWQECRAAIDAAGRLIDTE